MPIARDQVSTIIFDYGNTLIEFGKRQITKERQTFERVLTDMFGSCDIERVNAVRDRQIVAPYSNGYRENDMREITIDLVREIYDRDPTGDEINDLIDERHRWFVETVELPEGVTDLVERLATRYRLTLLSNFPHGPSIRDSADTLGLTPFFDAIVVSADIGYVKPHKDTFDALLSKVSTHPHDCLMVGDNWLADIQGSKQLGMQAIHTTQYVPYENFEPFDGDHHPDHAIEHLSEIEALLL